MLSIYLSIKITFSYELYNLTTKKMDLIGQAVHIRNVSKKLMFIDILEKVPNENMDDVVSNYPRTTVMLKYTLCGEKLMNVAQTSSSKIHVGDIVQFLGAYENEHNKTFIPSSFKIVSTWKEAHPNKSFRSIPPR